jgi:HAD superfamily hydrolase (TIGR01549 family)
MPRWICFDVGETLFDETGLWNRWADWLGAPRAEFVAELEAIIAQGEDYQTVFQRFRPGIVVADAQQQRVGAGDDPSFREDELFADVRPCLDALRGLGFRIGIAGNTSRLTEVALARCQLPVDFISSAASWGVSKPDPAFFARLAQACGVAPSAIVYVGDRLDNDVAPAERAGMTGVWLRRGLWAKAHGYEATPATARYVIDGLAELVEVARRLLADDDETARISRDLMHRYSETLERLAR